MNWLIQIETELQRIRPNENPGRIRTTARRVAGFAIRHYYNNPSNDMLAMLHTAANDVALPEEVRFAIERLVARLDANFKSPSVDPIGDAAYIVSFVKNSLNENS